MKIHKVIGRLLFLIIFTISKYAQSDTTSLTNSIIGSELIFDNCEKAKNIIDTAKEPLSPSDKEILTRYLDRILSLEPQSHQYLKPNPNTFTPSSHSSNLDMANFLDPEREKKAKICAVEVIPKLLPQSASVLIELIDVLTDRRNNPQLRDQSCLLAFELQQLFQRQGFPDYIINEIYNKLKSSDKILRSKVSIPVLLSLKTKININFTELLRATDPTLRDNILQTLTINDFSEPKKFNDVTNLLNEVDDGAKAQLISKLKYFAKNNPKLIELLPPLLNSTSDIVKLEASKLTRYLANNSATYAANYNNKSLPESIFSQYLEISRNSEESLSKDIIKLLLPLGLTKDNSFCNQDTDNLLPPQSIEEYSHDTAIYFLRKNICLPLKQEKALLHSAIKKSNLAEILPRLLTLLIQEDIDSTTLELLIKSEKNIKAKYSSKEYNLFLKLLLEAGLKIPNKTNNTFLADIAIKGLGQDLDSTPLLSLFLALSNNPAIDYLARSLTLTKPDISTQKLEQKISKLLTNKSPLIQKRALDVFAKVSEKKYQPQQQTIYNLTKLLNGTDIETRRSAYLILKSTEISLINKTVKLNQTKGASQFYLARLILDDKAQTEKNLKDLARSAYVNSLNSLDCRERTTAISDKIILELRGTDRDEHESIINSQTNCFQESSTTRIRAIKNIFQFPLSEHQQARLLSEYSKIISHKKDPQSITTILNSLQHANPTNNRGITDVLMAALNSSSNENTQAALRWIIDHDNSYDELNDKLRDLGNSDNSSISITSLFSQYLSKKDEELLKTIREKFYKNLERSENIIDIKISKPLANLILSSEFINDKSYFGIFLNTISCISEDTKAACELLQVSPSLIIDRPSFILTTLNTLVSHNLNTNETVKDKTKMIISTFFHMGLVEELTSLKKTPEVIRILNELRAETKNASYAKMLDFILEN